MSNYDVIVIPDDSADAIIENADRRFELSHVDVCHGEVFHGLQAVLIDLDCLEKLRGRLGEFLLPGQRHAQVDLGLEAADQADQDEGAAASSSVSGGAAATGGQSSAVGSGGTATFSSFPSYGRLFSRLCRS